MKYVGSAADCVNGDAASLDACAISPANAVAAPAVASPAVTSREADCAPVREQRGEPDAEIGATQHARPEAELGTEFGGEKVALAQNPLEEKHSQHNGDSEAERLKRAERASNLDQLWASYWADPHDDARNQLVEAYQRLVNSVVRRFGNRIPRRVDRGDLLTAGNVGLMGAVSGFDPERGVRFENYCERRIRGALLDELRSQDWLPRPWRHRIEQHKRTLEALRAESNREPRDEEVARAMGLSLDTYEQLFGVALPSAPTGTVTDSAGDEVNAGLEVVPDTRSAAPGEKLTRDEILELAAQRMSEQEYRIVYLKYWEGLSMREVGELTSLSESRVCKIHARLLDRLRDRFRGEFSGS